MRWSDVSERIFSLKALVIQIFGKWEGNECLREHFSFVFSLTAVTLNGKEVFYRKKLYKTFITDFKRGKEKSKKEFFYLKSAKSIKVDFSFFYRFM